MSFVRQRDILQQKKWVKELEQKFAKSNSEEDAAALIEAKNSLKYMVVQNKSYEKLFSK